jgi:glycosyltransferase involved in cell wall biosynthesis
MTHIGLEVALTTDIVDDVSNAKGVANYVRFLGSELAAEESEQAFTTVHFRQSDAPLYRRGMSDLIVDPYPVPGTGIRKLVTNRIRGRRALSGFDVVHATAPRLYYFPLFASDEYATVLTVHAMDLHIPEGIEATPTGEPHAWVQQTLLDHYFDRVGDDIDAIITVSEFLKDELIEHEDVPPEKIHPIHLAPEDHFRVTGASTDRVLILSDTPEPELIEMFRELKRAGFDHDLVVFSIRGYGYETARELVDEYGLAGDVEFKGYVPDEELVELYNTADVYVRFAGYEGFGLPPIEAMACGCPVVTTDVGSLPEVVSDAGILLGRQDIDGFVAAVSDVLESTERREAMVASGLEHVEEFSWERTVRETLEIYEEITDS